MRVLELATGKIRRAGEQGLSPDWSSDGRIALVTHPLWPRSVGSIQIRRLVGSHVTDQWLETGTDGHDSSPSWSPDGEQLVFATRVKRESTISIIDADGSDRHLLARHASSPAWSPDGGLIAYRTPCGIKFVTPSGGDATPGGHSGCVGRGVGVRGVPRWSPDGRWIAVSTGMRAFLGGYVIYVVSRDGSYKTNTGASSSSLLGLAAPIAWQPIPRTN